MIALTPQMKVHVYAPAIDFRNGIDGLAQICRNQLEADPFSGCLFLFRNRQATSVKILAYDGQGFWLLQKRLSEGTFRHWPREQDQASSLTVREISVLLFNGDPFSARMAGCWKKIV